ncbi:MAG: asparagine synthase-related protein [Nitrososphaeraceae archaeon]|nr:asparagine synthase-related protein [Nitrososphaeraceae archaeon]MDW3622576.1 asparagine synthase-related protein [Nitrososphaeraceae archaeon]
MIDIRNMLTLRYDPTIEIKTLVPKLVPDQVRIKRNETYPSSKEIEKELRQIINNNISKFESKTISLALSTGVDSNLILSLIRDEYPKLDIKCISVSFDETSEATYAKKIAESKDTDFYNVTVDNPLKDLPSLISIIKEPRWNLYQYYFIEKSKKYSNILFTGDGGDELFGGYTFRYTKFLKLFNEGDDWKQRVRHYLECHERDWVPDQEKIFGENIKFDWSSIYRILKVYFDNDLNPLDQVFLADYSGKLIYDFVPTNDKFFNYFGVTGLSPILDDKIIDMSFRIPPSIKFSRESNMGKIPLRKILSRLDTKNIADTKIGFGMDLKKLWITNAKEIVVSTLSSASIFRDKIISRDFYDRSIKRIEETSDLRYISKMLQLLSLEIWYKMYITFEVSSKYSL